MIIKPKAILVCVDYSEILALTLPYNRHHFSEVMVVTTPEDIDTIRLAQMYNCPIWPTDAFTRDGALFNKFRAMEEGLDALDRDGWLCIMDADVVWPKNVELYDASELAIQRRSQTLSPEIVRNSSPNSLGLVKGCLYTPFRRMQRETTYITPESEWCKLPRHRQTREWAGFTQIFHADDPVLKSTPWHEIDWTHGGGPDSFFQRKWLDQDKIRPTWDCLHIGIAGKFWAGRSKKSQEKLKEFLRLRKTNRNFNAEKI